MRKIDGSRSISSAMASRSASRKVITRGSGIDVLADGLRLRERRLLGELDRVGHLRLRLVVEPPELLRARDAERLDALAEDVDRVPLHPLLHLLLGAVLAGIGHRVAAEAIRLGLEEEWLARLARPLHGAARGVAHLEHVVAVDDLELHRVAARPDRDVGDGHGAVERRAHGVLVVLADEDDGQLPEPREREPLVERPHVRGTVAEEAERDVALLTVLARESHPGGDRHVAADDGPPAEEPLRRVEEVHRPAPSPARSGRTAVELGHGRPGVARASQVVGMLPVRRDDVVGRLRGRDGPDADRLLADVEVEKAADLPLRVGFRRGLLETAAERHAPIEVEQEAGIHKKRNLDYRGFTRTGKRRPQSSATRAGSASWLSSSPRAAARTGAKERRCTGEGPCSRMAAKWRRVAYPM